MNIRIEIGELVIHKSADDAPIYARDCTAKYANGGGAILVKKERFFNSSIDPPSFQAVWQLFTGCRHRGGDPLGVALIGSACTQKSKPDDPWYINSNKAVNYLRPSNPTSAESNWQTFAHELGHQLGAGHSFEEGTGNTGGIMDYGDGKLNGIYQFHTKYRKEQMCAMFQKLTGTFSDKWNTVKLSCKDKFGKAESGSPSPPPPVGGGGSRRRRSEDERPATTQAPTQAPVRRRRGKRRRRRRRSRSEEDERPATTQAPTQAPGKGAPGKGGNRVGKGLF